MLFLKQGAGFAVAVLRTVFVAMTIALMIWWFVEFAPVLSLAVTIGIVGMSTIVQNCVPPFVLFLSASTTMQLTVQQKLVGAMMPLQVYCLLDCDQAISPGMAREAGLTSLRAPVHEHWRDVVAELMDIAPVVVLDARFPTPAVLEEARHILNTNVAFKSFFIVGDDGERPVLDAILLDGSLPSDCRATAVTEIELLQTLVAMKWSPERRPRL